MTVADHPLHAGRPRRGSAPPPSGSAGPRRPGAARSAACAAGARGPRPPPAPAASSSSIRSASRLSAAGDLARTSAGSAGVARADRSPAAQRVARCPPATASGRTSARASRSATSTGPGQERHAQQISAERRPRRRRAQLAVRDERPHDRGVRRAPLHRTSTSRPPGTARGAVAARRQRDRGGSAGRRTLHAARPAVGDRGSGRARLGLQRRAERRRPGPRCGDQRRRADCGLHARPLIGPARGHVRAPASASGTRNATTTSEVIAATSAGRPAGVIVAASRVDQLHPDAPYGVQVARLAAAVSPSLRRSQDRWTSTVLSAPPYGCCQTSASSSRLVTTSPGRGRPDRPAGRTPCGSGPAARRPASTSRRGRSIGEPADRRAPGRARRPRRPRGAARPGSGPRAGSRRERLDHVVVGAGVEHAGRSRSRRPARSPRSPGTALTPREHPQHLGPSMSGRPRSSTTTSGRPRGHQPSPAIAVGAACTAWPRRDSARSSAVRMAGSSSINTSTDTPQTLRSWLHCWAGYSAPLGAI